MNLKSTARYVRENAPWRPSFSIVPRVVRNRDGDNPCVGFRLCMWFEVESRKPDPTWEELVALEPRLADLEAKVMDCRIPPDYSGDDSDLWFGRGSHHRGKSFANELDSLMGWDAIKSPGAPDIFKTNAAWDVAQEHLIGLLPDGS